MGLMDFFGERPFDVGLETLDADAELLSQRCQRLVDVLQGRGPVVLGVPLAEHVEIDPVQDEDLFHAFLQTTVLPPDDGLGRDGSLTPYNPDAGRERGFKRDKLSSVGRAGRVADAGL